MARPDRDEFGDEDFDDRPRRAKPSGGNATPWMWIAIGFAVLAFLGCAGIGALFFVGVRNAAVQEAARQEAERRKQEEEASLVGPADAADLAAEFKASPLVAAAKYDGKRVAVRLTVTAVETDGAGDRRLVHGGSEPRIVFKVPADEVKAAAGKGDGPVLCTGELADVSGVAVYFKGRVNR